MASVYIILNLLMLASTQSLAGVIPAQKSKYYILEPYKLELACAVTNQTKNVKWQHNGQELLPNSNGFAMTSTENPSQKIFTLSKTNTSVADAGKYKCIDETSGSNTFTVEVFKVKTHNINIVSKEQALIKCDIQNIATSDIQDFYWTKNHTLIEKVSELKGRYKEYKANYTLDIPKSKRRDAGPYNCVFKIDDKEFSIDVHMNMAPWIESMEKSRNLVQGDKLHLECKIQSHPSATVYWKKDNETMSSEVSNRVFLNSNRTLIIYDLQFSDRGDYTCVATNTVNSTSMTVLVRVKDKLAALWPFLGIVAEVVILCIIIFICEKRRSKDMEEEYENAGQQSMPNAKDHKGKDEIRQRNVRT